MIDIDELQALFKEYISTLDDDQENEMYTTDRSFAEDELNGFIVWYEKKIA